MKLTKPIAVPSQWEFLTPHAMSELVPYGTGINVEELAKHIAANGYDESEPIVLYEDLVFDGRHRHAAAVIADVVPTFVKFTGTPKQAEAFIEKKARRQHFSASQMAMFVARLLAVNVQHRENRTTSSSVQNCTTDATVADGAKRAGVSRRSVNTARAVLAKSPPEVVEAVSSGEIKVSDAAKIADKPAEVQVSAVEAVRSGQAKTATQAAEAAKEALKDAAGFEVPEVAEEAFRVADDIAKMCRELDSVHKRLVDAAKSSGGRLIHASALQTIKSLRQNLWGSRPTHVCPYCRSMGKYRADCNCCKGQGWTNKTAFENAPPEMRKGEAVSDVSF